MCYELLQSEATLLEQSFVVFPTWAVGFFSTSALGIMSVLAYAFWRFADRLIERDDLHDSRINGLASRVDKLEAQRRDFQ